MPGDRITTLPSSTSKPQRTLHRPSQPGGSSDWLERLVEAVTGIPVDERNYDLLAGYVGWLAKNRPHNAEARKRRAARSGEHAPALPQLCSDPGVSPPDVELMLGAFESGRLPLSRLAYLGYGSELAGLEAATISPLFGAMLDHNPEDMRLP